MQDIHVATDGMHTSLPADLIDAWSNVFTDLATARAGEIVGLILPLIDTEAGVEVIMSPQFILLGENAIDIVDIFALGAYDTFGNIDKSVLHSVVGQLACNTEMARQFSDGLEDAAVFEPSGGRSQAWIFSGGCLLMPEGANRLLSAKNYTSTSHKTLGDHFRILVGVGNSSHARIQAISRAQRIADFCTRYILQTEVRTPETIFKRHLKMALLPIRVAEK